MKSENLFKTFIAAVVAYLAMFSIPLFALENLKLSAAEVASVAVLAISLAGCHPRHSSIITYPYNV